MTDPKPRYQLNVSWPVLVRNRDSGRNDPAIIVRDYSIDQGNPYTMACDVLILGPSKLVNGSGQSVWLETDGPLELIGPKPGLDQ